MRLICRIPIMFYSNAFVYNGQYGNNALGMNIVLKYGGDSVEVGKYFCFLFSFYLILYVIIYLPVESDKYLYIICTQIKQIFNLTRFRTL